MRNSHRLLPLIALVMAPGCARPAGEIFPTVFPAVVFPSLPDKARVAYVGQLSTASDLRAAVSGWEAFKSAISGAKEDRSVSAPAGLIVSPTDKLYVTDPPQRLLHIFDLKARTYRAVSAAGNTPFAAPADVALAEGRIFMTDAGRGVIDVFSEAGEYQSTLSGVKFVRPVGIAYAADLRRLYVVDAGGHACVGLSLDGVEQVRFGRRGVADGELNFPTFVACDPRLGVVITDSMNFRIQIFNSDGTFKSTFGKKGDAAGCLSLPKGVAVDAGRHIYVADANFENIQVFEPDGRLLLAFGQEGQKPGQFWLPAKIVIDHQRRLWVADSYNRRIQVFRLMEEPPA